MVLRNHINEAKLTPIQMVSLKDAVLTVRISKKRYRITVEEES